MKTICYNILMAINFNLTLATIDKSVDGPHKDKGKGVPLHAMEAYGGRGGIAPTHT
jgi:hypothetical protein